MSASPNPRSWQIWVCCRRLDDTQKPYLTRQVASWNDEDFRLFAWSDERDSATRQTVPSVEVPTDWLMRGQTFISGFLHRRIAPFRARARQNSLAATPEERDFFAGFPTPGVIYAHTGPVGLRMLPMAEALNVPLVVHFHGHDVNTRDFEYLLTLRKNFHRFDSIIVAGEWMKERLAAMGCDSPSAQTIPMGAPALLADFARSLDASSSTFRFAVVGRLVRLKAIDRVIDAFARILHRIPTATLVIVGGGPERQALESQAGRLGISASVQFVGEIPSEETMKILAGSDVLVHNPIDAHGGPEAFGVAVTEAMMLSKPVIGSRCGGVIDQVVDGETGILVDQNDLKGLADAMLWLATEPELARRMGRRGRERAVAHFESDTLARQVRDHLDKVGATDHSPDEAGGGR